MVSGGDLDVLIGDWLAELTMFLLSRLRSKHPGGGYARTFVDQMEQVMGACLDRGVKVVSNAGGLNPVGCASAVSDVAHRLGLSPSIAVVDGDDLMPRITDLLDAGVVRPADPMNGIGDPTRYLTANAYLGCWGIVEALSGGADIVVTGRVTDAALACGPAAWWHGWENGDFDELAGAVVAGHAIECGAQVTGGNYAFFDEIPTLGRPGGSKLGFPWAEVAADGSAVIGKHDGIGGLVDVGTVTSQLLYEIGGPAYLGPDVVARFDTVRVEQVGVDRVRISGAVGEPPPSTLKVGVNELGGYRNSFGLALTGLDIDAKAEFARAAFWEVCPHRRDEFDSVTDTVVRTQHEDPPTQAMATAVWRLTVKDRDAKKVGRAFSDAMIHTSLASLPGMYPVSGAPTGASPFAIFRALTVPADEVAQCVRYLDGATVQVSAGHASTTPRASPVPPRPVVETSAGTPMSVVPFGRVIGARSGDKGGDVNLGVFVRTDAAWDWLHPFLTIDRLRELLPESASLVIERHRLESLRALNFLLYGFLGDGVAATTRPDPQAKALGEWLRARLVTVPDHVLIAEHDASLRARCRSG